MNNLNSLIIEGNATLLKSVENNGFAQTFCNLETSRFYKNSYGKETEEKSFFEFVCYGNMAQVVRNQLSVPKGLRLVGRLKQEIWTDENGKKHSKFFIVAEHIEFKPGLNRKAE